MIAAVVSLIFLAKAYAVNRAFVRAGLVASYLHASAVIEGGANPLEGWRLIANANPLFLLLDPRKWTFRSIFPGLEKLEGEAELYMFRG